MDEVERDSEIDREIGKERERKPERGLRGRKGQGE